LAEILVKDINPDVFKAMTKVRSNHPWIVANRFECVDNGVDGGNASILGYFTGYDF